ncbi:MAG: GspH/FimT family pseudopilin [Burkholderiaceae bacterium]
MQTLQNTHRPLQRTGGGQRGVTLIETCMVVAVVAILASTTAPRWQDLIDTRRLEGSASQLATDIQFSRSVAVARNQRVRLSLQTYADGSCYVVHTGNTGDCVCHGIGPAQCGAGAREIKTVTLPFSNHVVLQSNVASVLFDPNFGTTSPTATLGLLGTRGRIVHHVVNVMGRVRSCAAQGAVPGYRSC